jgi:competence protein ComEA
METPLSPFTLEPKTHPAEDLFLKYRYWIIGGLLIVFGTGIYLMLTPPTQSLAQDADAIATDELDQTAASNNPETPTANQIVVDVAGGVSQPGVYFLPSGSIVEDAIKSAGGFSKLADMDAVAKIINRAASVDTHSKIYIPKRGDNLATIIPSPTSTSSTTLLTSSSSKININTATASELDILPGIGPVTAQRIIDYRIQNGDFANIEEIKNVPGLGDAKFDALKDLITIG